jgi:hypothetical protein
MVLRISVPWERSYRGVVEALAVKVAEYLGDGTADPKDIAGVLERVGATVVPAPGESPHNEHAGRDVTFEFRRRNGELLIEAHCQGRSSEARHPLPA